MNRLSMRGDGGTVLLVDDEEMVLDVGVQMLEILGFQVFSAPSGQEALSIFQKEQTNIDLVILDLVMPDMGGGTAFDCMKQMKPAVKVLLSSGYCIDSEARSLLDRGCSGFLQKPFNIEDLSQQIDVALS